MFKNTYLRSSEFNRMVLRLALPGAIQTLLAIGVNTMNNLLTGAYFGEVEMSAVSQAATVFSIYEVITYGFACTCGVLVAQYWGKQDHERIKKVISITLRLESLLGAVFTAVMLLFPNTVMSVMSKDPGVISQGAEYLRITAPTYFLYGLIGSLYYGFRSVEMAQTCLWGNAAAYLTNMLLSWLLIPTRGVEGAALASLISRSAEAVFLFLRLFTAKRLDYKPGDLFLRSPELIGDFFRVTWPILGHELIWSIGNNMNQILMGRLDVTTTGAYSIAITLSNLLVFLNSGLGQAATTIVGKRIGEGDEKGAMKAARTFCWYTLFAGLFAAGSMFLLKDWFIARYNVSPEVKEMARQMILALEMFTFCSGFDSIILVSTLRAGGMGKVGFYTDIVVMWMIGIPLGWLGLLVWKLSPVWIIFLVKVDMPLKSLVGLYFVLKTHWIHNLTHAEEQEPSAV